MRIRKINKQSPSSTLPSEPSFSEGQLSLFQNFLCNTDDERDKLSNTIEFWDSIPKYAISQQAINNLRTPEGHLVKPLEKLFCFRGRECRIVIKPVIVDVREKSDGETWQTISKHFFPSANEELVEDALRKIAAEQNSGFFDRPVYETGVIFTLHLLREEMKKRGHTRSYYEVKRSLDILSGSIMEIHLPSGLHFPDGKGMHRSTFLPAITYVSRSDKEADPNAKWLAKFHLLVTHSIDSLAYRQFNYHQMMQHRSQLARWLHKQLAHNYINASVTCPRTIVLSDIHANSHLLPYKRMIDNVRKLEDALHELADSRVLLKAKYPYPPFVRDDVRGPRNKLLDVSYSLTPHPDFVKHVKAANKRHSDAQRIALAKTTQFLS